jgi:(2R)-sulfolactate sulfo-lyase subunit alpha
MPHKFLVHARDDSVGVAVEEIRAGERVEGIVLDCGSAVIIEALQNIPLGHKIALTQIGDAETVRKYGESIGKSISVIRRGEHVHVHNLKSTRW